MMSFDDWTMRIVDVLTELGDREYQERVWVRGHGPEVSSPDEAINRLYDDYDLVDYLQRPELRASPEVVSQLRQLDGAIGALVPLSGDEAFNSQEWERVRVLASSAKLALNKIVADLQKEST